VDLDELDQLREQLAGGAPPPAPPAGDGGQGADDLGHDPPPAPLRRDGAKRSSSSSSSPPRTTAAVRREINATISLPLEVIGQAWAIRDPYCGGRFLETRPAQAAAYTDLICQSQQWVDFFTGPAGGFMVYFKVGAAVWPVVEMLIAHHVTHAVGEPPGHPNGQAPAPDDLSRYVA
jgi:hypothetical protein